MNKTIKPIEYLDKYDEKSLFYEHRGDVICLHDDVNGELGWFKVWYDAEMNEREYITINNIIYYLDNLDRL